MKNTGGNASWLNGKNEIHNRNIHNMVRAALLDSNQHENKFCCAAEISSEIQKKDRHIISTGPHWGI